MTENRWFVSKVSVYQDKVNIKLFSSLSYGDSIRLVGSVTDAVTVNQMLQISKRSETNDVVTVRTHIAGLEDAKVFLTTAKKQIDELTKHIKTDNVKVEIDGGC